MRRGTVCLTSICVRRICTRCWRSGSSGCHLANGNDVVTGRAGRPAEPAMAGDAAGAVVLVHGRRSIGRHGGLSFALAGAGPPPDAARNESSPTYQVGVGPLPIRRGTVCVTSICVRRICTRCWRSGSSGCHWRTAMMSSRVEPGRPPEPAMAGEPAAAVVLVHGRRPIGSRYGGLFSRGARALVEGPGGGRNRRVGPSPLERVATGRGVSRTPWCVRRRPSPGTSAGAGALQMRLATIGRRRICQPGLRRMRLGTVCFTRICARRICARCWRSGPSGRLSTKGNDSSWGR
jgi:hypothetical protein